MQTQGNSRASLLANLRTGGVRSVSGVPHSAGPTATSFNIPRLASQSAIYEDDEDLIGQMQHFGFNSNAMGPRAMMNGSMTAGLTGPNQFQQQQMMMQMMLQQQQGMSMGNAEQQALQLQLQNEILILQAKQQQQQQQFQAQILAQAQAQQAQLQAQIQAAQAAQQAQSGLNTRLNPVINRRVSAANAVPSTAGPLQTSFNLGNPPARRTMSVDQDSAAPMTAAIGGRFGARAPSLPPITTLNPNAAAFSFGARVGSPTKENHEAGAQSVSGSPPNPSTTVISGGTSLGASVPTPTTSRAQADPSWRRPSQSSSPESQAQRLSPPVRDQSPVSRARPQPLRFNSALSTTVEAPQSVPSSPEPDVVATGTDGVQTILIDNGHSTGSRSPSSNSPTTPVGGEPLPREEAAKRLYEGLGMGRPLPTSQSQLSSAMGSSASLTSLSGASTPARAVSQAVRQPRGPPTEVSELGPRNFASRVRSKAIGGLEAMILARNRRQGLDVEAF
ncbi:hypothetical protein FRC11_009550 [Ceratobasidium sp. 423]|nr:hypothetical protein FRC11_009550 [Ceratobasidium sp. 423]